MNDERPPKRPSEPPAKVTGSSMAPQVPAGAAAAAGADLGTLPTAATEIELRSGDILRVTTLHVVETRCDLGQHSSDNTGAAAAQARSARHRVNMLYRNAFAFVPLGGNP